MNANTSCGCGCAPQARLDLLLLGAPGSGKGTQASILIKEFGLPHVATGDLFRENLKNQTELGKLAKTYMDKGQLVPDDVTADMVADRLTRPDVAKGFILDGFPRTLPQAEAFAKMMKKLGRKVAALMYIKVSDEEIEKRLTGRLICRGCQTPYHLQFKPSKKSGVCDACGGELYQRDDDKPATVKARLKVFHDQTKPLIEFYQKAGLRLMEVHGEGKVDEVNRRTLEAVKKVAASL